MLDVRREDLAWLDRIAERAADCDHRDGELSADVDDLRSAGWLTACLPQRHGGKGWGCEPDGTQQAFDVLRCLGRANLSLARLFEGHMNAVKLIALYASPEQIKDVARTVRDGQMLGVWGADDRERPVYCDDRDDGSIELRGAKIFTSGLGVLERGIVIVTSDGPATMFLVPCHDEDRMDFSTWMMSGMRASQSGSYDFSGIVVSTRDAIGKAGDYSQEPWFEGGIWRYCAAHLGGAERLFDAFRDRLIERKRAADPHQQRRIVEAATALETARLWLVRTANEIETEDPSPKKANLALLAREATHDACQTVIGRCEEALGMEAHVEGSVIERMRRDLSLYIRQAAPDAKRARAADALVEAHARAEHL